MTYIEKRKVAFREWIPAEFKEEDNPYTLVEGTGDYSPDKEIEGRFLQFIQPTSDDSATYALVEMPDGTVRRVDIDVMRFIKPME